MGNKKNYKPEPVFTNLSIIVDRIVKNKNLGFEIGDKDLDCQIGNIGVSMKKEWMPERFREYILYPNW